MFSIKRICLLLFDGYLLVIIIVIILIKCSCMFVHTLHSPKNKTLHVSDSLGNMIHFIIVIIFLTFNKNFVCDVRKQTI